MTVCVARDLAHACSLDCARFTAPGVRSDHGLLNVTGVSVEW